MHHKTIHFTEKVLILFLTWICFLITRYQFPALRNIVLNFLIYAGNQNDQKNIRGQVSVVIPYKKLYNKSFQLI